jgi:hypothetical protein
VTEQERIDRETLLKRAAAAAGALYVAPVLTASAVGSADARSGQCPCYNTNGLCGYTVPCGDNCGCFRYGRYGRRNVGRWAHCIYMEDGLCDTFMHKHGTCPGGDDSECGEGKVCFYSCCNEIHGYPPLCAECCSGRSGPAPAPRSTGGPMIGWL